MDLLAPIIITCVACGFIGSLLGSQKNAAGTGLLLGLLLGPVGVIATLLVDQRDECPECHGRLNGSPRLCEHCGSLLQIEGADPNARACIVCHTPVPDDAPTDRFKRWCSSCSEYVGTIPLSEASR